MNKYISATALLVGISMTIGLCSRKKVKEVGSHNLCDVACVEDIVALFPKTPEEIKNRMARYQAEIQEDIKKIIAIEADKRSFANTAKAYDDLVRSNFFMGANTTKILEYVSPDKQLRDAAQEAVLKANNFSVEEISDNIALYKAFKEYADGNAKNESLTAEQRYFLKETMDDFKRGGLDLPEDKRVIIKNLKKELAELSLKFGANVAEDNTIIAVERKDLAGLKDDFINALKCDDNDTYLLGLDYPTYFNVLENCTIEETRKKMSQAFSNRSYPQNEELLKHIIAKRDALARELGFKSYAHLDLDDQMAGDPDKVETFLRELIAKSEKKAQEDFTLVTADLPDSISLTADGKIKPWDTSFLNSYYKKKHFNLDERKVAEYFPMEKTIEELLDIYHHFLSVDFKEVPISGLWHKDVKLVSVSQSDQQLGYLLLDLHPRQNKYTHACHITISRSVYGENGEMPLAVSLLIANFPKATAQQPSLLKRSDVKTFFHEFGHALHALLGRTNIASFAGTSVKTDFVEMPSQMLEDWLSDRDILKKVTNHYLTGESLSDEIIDSILALKKFGSGGFVLGQSIYSFMSLYYYGEGAEKDPYAIMKDLYTTINKNYMFDQDSHMYASFGHLTGYGAKYYGYLWSKVFAKDLFAEIKKHGLLNPKIGRSYVDKVIGKGGSQDPYELLKNFLGREPNQQAFLDDLGLKKS